MDLVGENLGQFQIIEEIGKGGMATVYKAYQPSLRRYVAIKVLSPALAEDMNLVKRFLREARSAAALHHPNVIVVHDVGSEDSVHYIVSELLEGKTLSELLKEGEPLTPERVLGIVRQIAEALDYAHSQGFIHRDIKPSNIMVDPARDDRVTLMDFGLVRVTGGSKITRTGFIMGTPDYMSPEQAKGDAIDHRTDIYSLGVTMYHMLTGGVPFSKTTPHAILLAHIMEDPPPMSQPDRVTSPEVEAVVSKAMAKQAEDRYEWAGDMVTDLEIAITNPAAAALQTTGEPVRRQKTTVVTPVPRTPPSGVAARPQTPPGGVSTHPRTPPGGTAYPQAAPGRTPYPLSPPAGTSPYSQTPPSGVAMRAARPRWVWPVLIFGILGVVAALVIAGLVLAPVLLPRIPAIASLTADAATVTAIAAVPTSTIVFSEPAIEYFQVEPQVQVRGGQVELSWWVTGETTRIEISEGGKRGPAFSAEGTLDVVAEETTTFVLTAYNGDVSTTVAVTLVVLDPTLAPTQMPTDTPTQEPSPTLTPASAPTSTPVPPTGTPTSTPTVAPPTATAAVVPPTATQAPAKPTAVPAQVPSSGVFMSFEQWGTWKRGEQPYGELSQTQEQAKSGKYAAKLSYDFPVTDQDFVVFVNLMGLSGNPNTISAWVYGDGSGHFVNVWIQDAENEVWQIHLGKVGAAGWQQLSGPIDPSRPWPTGRVYGPDNGVIDYPIRFYGIVLDRPGSGPQSGQIYIDDLTATEAEAGVQLPGVTVTPELGEPSPGQIGRIVFTVKVGKVYSLYSTDPSWGRMVKIGDTDWGHSTCADTNVATTLDGINVNLRDVSVCQIAGTVGSCESPNGLYKVNTNRSGDRFSVTLWRVSDEKMLEAYHEGRLNTDAGINWAPDSSHFLFTIDQSVYRANVGQAGYYQIIPFKASLWPLQYTPDGTRVYYLKPVNGAISDIFVANPDGSNERNLTNASISEKLCPRWRG